MSESDLSYEQAVARLKEVVDRLEQGNLDLEESLRLFEEGVSLSRLCEDRLRVVEARVQVLVEKQEEKA
ncbi:MAG: exodeoxyribonuclease VII small subunit [Candidatus Eremiobacterota bacterium]